MRFACFMGAALTASAVMSWAQSSEPTPAAKAPEAPALRLEATRTYRLEGEGLATDAPVVHGKRYQVGGAVAEPLKARGVSGFFRSLGRLVNPFAPSRSEPRLTPVENVSPRAWTSVAGWRPGASAFPDPTTHEPSMALFVLSPGGKK